jgi:ParB family transcriptional regulator, chromosome partitioning protein
MSRKDTIATLFERKAAPSGSASASDKDRVRTGAISAMGASLKELSDGAKAAARLQEQLENGSVISDLDPAKLDNSFVSDRLPLANDKSFEELLTSIKEQGQILPILVRPHPDVPGRYQIAYGHRRAKAASMLGIKVRAIIKSLSNAELVVAQGKENLERRDLSFIEKAFFARRLEDQGFDRTTIIAALATDKADLSRYISIARLIPEPLAQAIGPASKIGRSRWQSLSVLLTGSGKFEPILTDPGFLALDSDGRFSFLFAALSAPTPPAMEQRNWSTPSGQKGAKIDIRKDRTVITFEESAVPNFGPYLADRLSALYEDFLRNQQGESR